MPLGAGYTAEEQLTGEAVHGGIQIIAYPMKKERFKALHSKPTHFEPLLCSSSDFEEDPAMLGLAPGGLMHQEIYEDEYGFDAWDTAHPSRCFIHILNSTQYQAVTGKQLPTEPPSAKSYTDAGLPWFEYYSESLKVIKGAESLAGMDSVTAKGVKKGETPVPENAPVNPSKIVGIAKKGGKLIRDGNF